MAQTFPCSNCGATLEYSGAGRTMKCDFCNADAAVPEELWRPAEAAGQEAELQKTTKKWLKYLWIFLAITVGLPLCLSLAGALLGVLASILGVSLPFILPKLFH